MTPTDETNFRVALYFREGASDKVYEVELVRSGDLYRVQFAYGRRGSTLTTGTKTPSAVPLEKAKSIAEKLVLDKKAKGYTEDQSGTRYAGTESAGAVSGLLPQLLTEADEEELQGLLSDARVACQEKMDGRRTLIVKTDSDVKAVNRKGLYVGCPAHWGGGSLPSCVLDGEGIGERFFAFDVLEVDGRNYRGEPFGARFNALDALIAAHRPSGITLVAATCVPEEKRALFERVKREKREGVVFKAMEAPYTAGKPASGGPQRKFKFTESSTFVVSAISDSKRSVAVAAFDNDGMAVDLGNVTIPPNHAVPTVGSLVEVRYLYRFAAGSLFQPAYLGVRDDLDTSAATLSQIKRIKEQAAESEEE